MSVRGWAQGCVEVQRGSTLVADAPSGTTVLTVEDTTDFDDDGGVIQLNDELLTYSADSIDEDAGTIALDAATTVDASTDDRVVTMAGGKPLTDKILYVSCGDGDAVEVQLPFVQRDYWAEGDYDDPVPVVLSNDLERVIDAPGVLPKSVALTEVQGGYPGTLQDIYDRADEAAAQAADAATNATTALTAANGKNKVTYSLSGPGATPNTAGDIWFQKNSAQTIIGQWEGLGGTSWSQKTVDNAVIANLDAGKLVAGSAFINGLWIKTNFTLGDASTNGVIQSYNFSGSSVGVFIDKNGLVAKGGSIAGASITGGTITGATVYAGNTTITGGGIVNTTYGWQILDSGDASLKSLAVSSAITANGGIDVTSGGIDNTGGIRTSGGINVSGGGIDATGTITLHDISGSGGASYVTVGNGGVLSRGGVVPSSERHKHDIQPSGVDPRAVYAVEDASWLWNNDPDGPRDFGFMAERVRDLGLTPFVGDVEHDGETVPGIDYIKFAAVGHQAAIRDLHARNQALEQEVDDLKAAVAELRALVTGS